MNADVDIICAMCRDDPEKLFLATKSGQKNVDGKKEKTTHREKAKSCTNKRLQKMLLSAEIVAPAHNNRVSFVVMRIQRTARMCVCALSRRFRR